MDKKAWCWEKQDQLERIMDPNWLDFKEATSDNGSVKMEAVGLATVYMCHGSLHILQL